MYNLRTYDEKYIKFKRKNKKIIVTRSPFNSGLLTNNFSKYVYYQKQILDLNILWKKF